MTPPPPIDDPKKPDDGLGNSSNDFTKSPQEQMKDSFVALPDETRRQRMTKAFLWTIITLSTTLAVPCGSLAYSYGQEKAKRETEERKKKAEAKTTQRKLQLDLLKEIIIVAKTAEFKDPKSIYRLGLIAHMVNENNHVFGIQLAEAEDTMKRMFDRLAPLAGLRRRLSESQILLSDLSNKYKTARKGEKEMKTELKELSDTLAKTRNLAAWRKRKLKKAIKEKISQLQQYRTERQFYEERLVHEKKVRTYFSSQLAKQEKSLRTALQETTKLRDRIKRRTKHFNGLVKKLQTDSANAKETVKKLQKALKAMEDDHSKAEQAIKRLRSELQSERTTLDATKKALRRCFKKFKECKEDLKLSKEEKVEFVPTRSNKRKATRPTARRRSASGGGMMVMKTVRRSASTVSRPVMKASDIAKPPAMRRAAPTMRVIKRTTSYRRVRSRRAVKRRLQRPPATRTVIDKLYAN